MFKPGDKVRCVDDSDSSFRLERGQIYTVREGSPHRGEVYLEEVSLTWLTDRFILVEKAPDKEETEFDEVNKAAHYNQGRFECIEVAEEIGLQNDAFLFNTFKYIWRRNDKGTPKKDLQKAMYYLKRKIDNMPDDEE